jgi:CBS domain-containing protein
MNAKDIMTENVRCCTEDATLVDCARIMLEHDCGEVPVVDDMAGRKLVGVITDRDITIRAVAKGLDPVDTDVSEVMTDSPITARPDQDVEDLVMVMAKKQIRRIPVVDDDNCLVGIVSLADIARTSDDHLVADAFADISQPEGRGYNATGQLASMRTGSGFSARNPQGNARPAGRLGSHDLLP